MDKLIAIKSGGDSIVGFARELGRVEHLFTMTDAKTANRIVNAYNATQELADDTLAAMASGGTKAGSLGERVVAWSMFWQASTHTAAKILQKARQHISTQPGGKV